MPNFESDLRPPYLDSLANYPVSDIYVPFYKNWLIHIVLGFSYFAEHGCRDGVTALAIMLGQVVGRGQI